MTCLPCDTLTQSGLILLKGKRIGGGGEEGKGKHMNCRGLDDPIAGVESGTDKACVQRCKCCMCVCAGNMLMMCKCKRSWCNKFV